MQEKIIGKQAVKEAVIEAACDLFSEKSPARVSIREIAEKAGVNHGLIHRHFGSKRNLISEVVAHIDRQIREASDSGGSFQEIFRLASEAALNDPRVWKIPARLIIDGEAELLQENQSSFLKELRTLSAQDFDKTGFRGLSPDESIFLLISLGLGIEMFGEYVSSAMDIRKPDINLVLRRVLSIISSR